MTLSEKETARPPGASSAAGKPSLLSGDAASAAPGGAETQPMRMLDALETKGTSRPKASAGPRATWLFALGLGVVAAAAFWAWDHSRSPISPGLIEASRQSRVVDAAVATPLSEPALAPAPATDPFAGPASIERTAAAERKPATVRPFAAAPVASATRATVAAVPPVASSAQAVAQAAAPAIAPRAVAARANPRPVPPTVAAAVPPSGDPDVTLLSAMLARLSGDSPVASPRPTIAQLVERCEAHAANDSIEAFECKRRICAGYWGKAEACPMALAPRRN